MYAVGVALYCVPRSIFFDGVHYLHSSTTSTLLGAEYIICVAIYGVDYRKARHNILCLLCARCGAVYYVNWCMLCK